VLNTVISFAFNEKLDLLFPRKSDDDRRSKCEREISFSETSAAIQLYEAGPERQPFRRGRVEKKVFARERE
jgi:hypothetical protein